MILASAVGLYSLGGTRVAESSVRELVFPAVASWSFSVVPLFILLGVVLWKGGLAAKAYEAARQWIGGLPGGLAVATNFAGAGLAAGSGSSVGTAYALGQMGLPQMFKAGYKPSLATGSVAMAGTLGQIIPPSTLLVIFAGVAQTPVGPQLIGGMLPGIILAVGFASLIVIRVVINPSLAPPLERGDVTWRTRWKSLLGVLPIIAIVVIVLGGIFSGFFTATESAAFAVVAALLASWRPGNGPWFGLPRLAKFALRCVRESAPAIGAIMLVIIGSTILTRALAFSGVTKWLTDHLVALNADKVVFLLVLLVLYLILGMFLEPLPLILLTVPVLQGPLEHMGVDMLWFGVFLVILAEIGLVTPPVGMLAFVVHRMATKPDMNNGVPVTLADTFRGVVPFVVLVLLVLVGFILVPDIVLWLPSLSAG